ncbi:MAG: S8 family peptidase [Parahaliea sp.]
MTHFLPLMLILGGVLLAPTGSRAEQSLKVMLQGESSTALAELVRCNGGTVTHELHIINAVGALVSREQLTRIAESPLVSRYIDDLSFAPAEPAADTSCNVGGALELEIGPYSLQWRLYNKGELPATLTTLQAAWPGQLGELKELRYNGEPLPFTREAITQEGATLLRPSVTHTLEPGGKTFLELRFTSGNADSPPLQSDISLKANFQQDCETSLIPGYTSYGSDTYYPAVAGAATLHQLGVTGLGVTIAVLDSGLWEHSALSQDTQGRYRIRGRYDAIRDLAGEVVFDESGHGTHMTSVLAHSGKVTRQGAPPDSYMGMAPDVDIVAVKAFNKTGQGDFLDIVRGIQWIVDQREALGIRVLNLSFAARPRWPYWLDPVNQAVMRAWAAGIAVVAAAGNEGPADMTVGSPGNLPYVITVGAVTDSWTPEDRNDDYIPDFSSRGPTPSAHIKPDIVAPGGHIAGITRPGSSLTLDHPDYLVSSGEFVMTGTSQASALVSGIIALLLQLEPDLSPDDLKCKLTSSAEPAINRDGRLAYSPFVQGDGYANATRAVTLGLRGCGNPGLNISQDIKNLSHFEGPATISDGGTPTLPGLAELYSGTPSEKGMSHNRRWGAKAHIEREGSRATANPFVDWTREYLLEKQTVEYLTRDPAAAN